MNHHQLTCDPGRIERFLGGSLSDVEQAAFESHLDDCLDCRRRLETAAAGKEVWSGVRESLLSEPAERSDSADLDLELVSDGTAPYCHAAILSLLAPSDDERSLGRLGTYEVVGVVGSGGMGVVLKAFDAALDRYVAIKLMAPHLGGSGAARRRFAREAKAAAAVVHDNVIEIRGVSDANGLPYLVMPYVRGPSLQQRLDEQGALATAEILRIGMQAALGLAAAHAQGLIHRDVSPGNILLEEGVERVKLTDFGLARAADDASLTRSGMIAGTPQYMSPEQARGESLDQRSDLFSLGSVLYAMCTGRAPFRAETSYGVLRRITDEEPRPIREINPDVPEWLCRIIARLMAKTSSERFQSAREVADVLERCLAHVQQPTAAPLPEEYRETANHPHHAGGQFSIGGFLASKPPVSARWLIGLSFFFALLLAGVMIVLELNNGTLTIQSEADDVPIRVMQGHEVAEALTVTRRGTAVRVAAGEYVVEIAGKADGIAIENGTVRLERGGREIVKIVKSDDASAEGEGDHALRQGTALSGKVQMETLPDGSVVLRGSPDDVRRVAQQIRTGEAADATGGEASAAPPSVDVLARLVAMRIESLKDHFRHLREFSASKHLHKNSEHNGHAPGTPENPELYSIGYSHGVFGTELLPRTGPRRSASYTFDPETGIWIDIHFFKGDTRGNDLTPPLRIGDISVHVHVKGPAAAPIAREIRRILDELAAGTEEAPKADLADPGDDIFGRGPATQAEKTVARLVLVFFQDRSRRAVPAVLVDAGTHTLAVTAGPATIVPDAAPAAIDRAFLEIPGRETLDATFVKDGAFQLAVYRAARGLTEYQMTERVELAPGDELSAIWPDVAPSLFVTPAAARVVAVDRKAELNLPERGIEANYEGLVEIDRLLPEGAPVFKDGKLAGLTLLGTRFAGGKGDNSYVMPVAHIRGLLERQGLLENPVLSKFLNQAAAGDAPAAPSPVPAENTPGRTRLRVLDAGGKPVADNRVILGRRGYDRDLPGLSATPSHRGVISLDNLNAGTHWLMLRGDPPEVFKLVLPAGEGTIVRSPPRRPSLIGKNFDAELSVGVTGKNEIIIVKIHNRTQEAISLSELSFDLLTAVEGPGADAHVLSPQWSEDAAKPEVLIEPGETATLGLDWSDWVRRGFWFSRDGEPIAEPAFPEAAPGRTWVRIAQFSAMPVEVTHPDKIIAIFGGGAAKNRESRSEKVEQ